MVTEAARAWGSAVGAEESRFVKALWIVADRNPLLLVTSFLGTPYSLENIHNSRQAPRYAINAKVALGLNYELLGKSYTNLIDVNTAYTVFSAYGKSST
jgi:hypothetical protein